MAKYKVLEDFVLNGIPQVKDSIIELDQKMSSLKSIQANIEKVVENPDAPKDSSILGNIVVGRQISEEERKKLADENERITAEAHQMAAEQNQADQASGRATPPVQVVADALKEKLQKEEFQNTEPPADNTPQA